MRADRIGHRCDHIVNISLDITVESIGCLGIYRQFLIVDNGIIDIIADFLAIFIILFITDRIVGIRLVGTVEIILRPQFPFVKSGLVIGRRNGRLVGTELRGNLLAKYNVSVFLDQDNIIVADLLLSHSSRPVLLSIKDIHGSCRIDCRTACIYCGSRLVGKIRAIGIGAGLICCICQIDGPGLFLTVGILGRVRKCLHVIDLVIRGTQSVIIRLQGIGNIAV